MIQKKTLRMLVPVIVMFMLLINYSAAFADAGKSQETIHVLLDSKEIKFNAAPISRLGTVYVEFRSLFALLGYTVTYNASTKIIIAKSPYVTLQMQLGSDLTLINDKESVVSARPFAIDGHTLVPLRFISEATGLSVTWNKSLRIVNLTYQAPSDRDLLAIKSVLEQQKKYASTGNLQGLLSTYDSQSPLREEFEDVKQLNPEATLTNSIFSNFKLLSWESGKASVSFDVQTKKAGEGFYLDRKDEVVTVVTRSSIDGSWLIYDLKLTKTSYINAEESVKQDAQVPSNESAAILSVIEQNTKAWNEENTVDLISTYNINEEMKSAYSNYFEQWFKESNVKYFDEMTRIVYFKQQIAYVYMVQKSEQSMGENSSINRIYKVIQLNKNVDGKWQLNLSSVVFKKE